MTALATVRHHFDVLRSALADERERRAATRGKPKAKRHELQFMPASLEVMDTPASPLGRATALAIAAFFVIAITWAVFGKIDIIATAQGKIIPTSRVKVIQPVETGTVRAIHVAEGQAVREGDILVELNPTEADADRNRLQSELTSARVAMARLKALLTDDPTRAFSPPPGAPADLIRVQRSLLEGQWAGHRTELASMDGDIAKQEAQLRTSMARRDRLESLIPRVRERVEGKRQLVEKAYIPRLTFVELEEQLLDQEGQLEIETQLIEEAWETLRATQSRKAQATAKFRQDIVATLAETRDRAASIEQELIKASEHARQRTLTAPVDGVVQQLAPALHTVGGVVTPAQELMVVVPADTRLEVEAMVLNKDIGFVHDGQAVEIKVDSFPFTKYGTIDGEVLHVSRDAVQDEKLGLIYPARIRMDRATMAVEDRLVNLGPGMSLTVEIKTGKRRLIEYLLAPLQQYRDESMRER